MKVSAEVEISGIPVTVTGDVHAEDYPEGRGYIVTFDHDWHGNETWLERELIDAFHDEQAIARWRADERGEDGKS